MTHHWSLPSLLLLLHSLCWNQETLLFIKLSGVIIDSQAAVRNSRGIPVSPGVTSCWIIPQPHNGMSTLIWSRSKHFHHSQVPSCCCPSIAMPSSLFLPYISSPISHLGTLIKNKPYCDLLLLQTHSAGASHSLFMEQSSTSLSEPMRPLPIWLLHLCPTVLSPSEQTAPSVWCIFPDLDVSLLIL